MADKLIETTRAVQLHQQKIDSIKNQLAIARRHPDRTALIDRLTQEYVNAKRALPKLQGQNNTWRVANRIKDKVRAFASSERVGNVLYTLNILAAAAGTYLEIKDVCEAYAMLEANIDAFDESLDLFEALANHGDDPAKTAGTLVYDAIKDSQRLFYEKLEATIADFAEGMGPFFLMAFITKNGYVFAVVAGFHLMDWVLGQSAKVEKIHHALDYESITTVAKELTQSVLVEKKFGFDCNSNCETKSKAYMIHLAQLRILGENNFVDYSKNKDWINKRFPKGYNEAKAYCKGAITRVRESANLLHLKLSSNLTDFKEN